jgi:hypothetical protein
MNSALIVKDTVMIDGYEVILELVKKLDYRDKLRLAQTLIQLARKEEEEKNESQNDKNELSLDEIELRIKKSKPATEKALINFIQAMFQFTGGASNEKAINIMAELKKRKSIKVENGKIIY